VARELGCVLARVASRSAKDEQQSLVQVFAGHRIADVAVIDTVGPQGFGGVRPGRPKHALSCPEGAPT
jgi:hypothetical protein